VGLEEGVVVLAALAALPAARGKTAARARADLLDQQGGGPSPGWSATRSTRPTDLAFRVRLRDSSVRPGARSASTGSDPLTDSCSAAERRVASVEASMARIEPTTADAERMVDALEKLVDSLVAPPPGKRALPPANRSHLSLIGRKAA
jgi:hypothetical protein